MAVDTEALKARVDLIALVGHYSALKRRGREALGRCVAHSPDEHPSMYVVPDRGFVYCHACGFSADAIDFVRHVEGVDFTRACEILGANGEWKPSKPIPHEAKRPERITSKPPSDAPAPDMAWYSYGEPDSIFPILDIDGGILGYEARYKRGSDPDSPDKSPSRIWTWGHRGKQPPKWECGVFNTPRPLYGLEQLSLKPDAPVAVFEGPKKALAGRALLPMYACVSWTGGANSVHKHDWSPLAGRRTLLWPDADPTGSEAMQRVARILGDPRGYACNVRIIDPIKQPDGKGAGWDAADAEIEGWDTTATIDWAKPRTTDYTAPQQVVDSQEPAPSSEPSLDERPEPPPPAPVTAEQDAGPFLPPPPIEAYAVESKPKAKRQRLKVVGGSDVPPPDAEPLPVSMSEDAIADAFAEEHERNWRYVAAWGHWMHWEDSGWKRDQKELIDRLAVEMCRRACTWGEAQSLTPDARRRLGQRKTAGAVRDIARNDRRLAASAEGWDADPLLIGIPGGVFDVRTGKVIEGDREQYITRCTAVVPAEGEPKLWLSHLKRMMAGDADMVRFLQYFAGYCATGDVSEQCFLFLYGMGQTGKGTFLLTLGELLGSYAAQSSASTFMSTDREKHSSEIARLLGCRLVIVDETDGTQRWNEERIKRMTGGGKITAARKYHDETDIPVTWKLAFAGNHKPALRGVGKEMERRIRLVKCNESIPDEEVDRRFREHMIAVEGPQILNWILQGAVQWHQAGLPLPESISDATRDYLQSEDTLGEWLSECCTSAGDTKRSDAYKDYAAWSDRQGSRPWSNRAWWAAMEDRGYKARKITGIFFVGDLGLKSPADIAPRYS